MPILHNNLASVVLGDDLAAEYPEAAGALFALCLFSGNGHLLVGPPVFPIEGAARIGLPRRLAPVGEPANVFGGVREYRFAGHLADEPDGTPSPLTLELVFRLADASPVVRFRYVLRSGSPVRLTRPDGPGGADELTYLTTSLTELSELPDTTEVRFSEFSSLFHTFLPTETPLGERHFDNGVRLFGPLLAVTDTAIGGPSALLAYEHGSQAPDAFLAFDLSWPRGVSLRAVQGNYCDGQVVGPDQPFETPWFQMALVDGDADELAREYRTFVLRHLSPNAASRTPYVFCNTWNFQERNKWWYKNRYLDSMNEARMLAEIDVAHRMGIDVFVLDTGWYEKTGDWRVSRSRFPNGLAPIKAKLDEYGMKLGLWFNPTVAALSSEMRRRHEDCLMTRDGKPGEPHEVWETEASQGLCLVSRYGDAFADELIRLHREVGVTYFKWDAIGQYGCDAPGHGHGDEHNTVEERRNSYGFQLGAAMTRVVDKLCAACPDAIVDFDITEGGRTVGLQFLAAGKYFLINNGPYSHNYDLPVPADGNVNLFFYPGPARAWICRTPLTYDRWLPSVLFLTHYLPDDVYTKHGWGSPREVQEDTNQWISLASLVLGQNGIWGDLLRVTDEGIARFGDTLARYKQVRDDITEATLLRTGDVGGSPEVYEKINPATGRGVVSIFASTSGTYTYVTAQTVAESHWTSDAENLTVARDAAGRARLDVRFEGAGAKLVFFGVAALA